MALFLLGRNLGEELLAHTITKLTDFSKWLHHFTPLQAVYEGEDFSTSSRAHYYPTENVVIFVGTKWCLIAVLIYISLMTS